jgi:Holliday junction resolvasome RuvABC endonuclease subunit
MPYILGIDPGFANVGISVVQLDPRLVVAMRVFRTQKTAVRKVSDDNLQRATEISKMLFALYDEFPAIKIVCAESMSYPPNAGTATKMSLCWGVLAAFVQQRDLAFIENTPQEIKKRVCGNKSASKEEVKTSIKALFPSQDLDTLHLKLAAGLHEHIYDATAAVIAAWDSSEMKLFRALSGGK